MDGIRQRLDMKQCFCLFTLAALIFCVVFWIEGPFVPQEKKSDRGPKFAEMNASLRNFIANTTKAVLVLQANIGGRSVLFSKTICLTPTTPTCLVVMPAVEISNASTYSLAPTTDMLIVNFGGLSTTTTSHQMVSLLSENPNMFDKVLVNHPLGFSHDFLQNVFDMNKRYVSITHDYVWVFDKVQPTFAELRAPDGALKNNALNKFLPKLEVKCQSVATKSNIDLMANFKSVQYVTMPDYVRSQRPFGEGLGETSSNLVIAVIVGDMSPRQGLDRVLAISRQPIDSGTDQFCPHFRIGYKYIQLGSWRLGQADSTRFSFSHQNEQTTLVFSSDGSTISKRGFRYSLWRKHDGVKMGCQREVKFGSNFVQIGDWRLGVSQENLILSHRTSNPIVLGNITLNPKKGNDPHNVWNQPIRPSETSNVLVSMDLLKMDGWHLLYKKDELMIVHESYGATRSFHSNGSIQNYDRPSMPQPLSTSRWCTVPRNIPVVVLGAIESECNAGDNLHMHNFENIWQFNMLMRILRPNVILVTSNWPDTYSYAFTLAMLTNLSMIVQRSVHDFDCAVVERAQQYPKAYFHDFENIESVVTLARKIKATSFTEVSPQLFVPPQWQNLMHPHLFNVVLVASKIITSSQPLWYAPRRSRFSPEERFQQTMETIASIRSNVPHSFVVLIDNSELTQDQWKTLRSSADVLVNDVNNEELRQATDKAEAKQLGEAKLLLQGLAALEQHQVMFKQLFKLTGRYLINEKFRFGVYDNAFNIFKLADIGFSVKLQKPYYAYTSFFNIYILNTWIHFRRH